MSLDLKVIEGAYLGDILQQPEALDHTLAVLDRSRKLKSLANRLNQGRFRQIVLTGMGSSFHALHPLTLQLIGHGHTAIMVETSELVHYKNRFFDPRTLIVAVSQSGESVEMVRLAAVNRKRSPVIAVTNSPESSLAKHADAIVPTHAGKESSVSCKTYVTALMALKWVGDALCTRDDKLTRRELKLASPAVAAYLAHWKDHVEAVTEKLRGIRDLFFVGRGSSLAAAGVGALTVKESDLFHAEGMSSAAFRHGPFEMLSPATFVAIFSGEAKTRDLNRRLRADILESEGHSELIGETAAMECFRLPDHGGSVRCILEILPVQMITLALAALAGREPGKFRFATKITTRE